MVLTIANISGARTQLYTGGLPAALLHAVEKLATSAAYVEHATRACKHWVASGTRVEANNRLD